MKILIDLLPVALFFTTFKLYDIYVATAVLIGTSMLQVVYLKLSTGKVEKKHTITLALLIFFGGATIIFQNEDFIKWKVTIINALFAIVLVASDKLFKKNLVQLAMQSIINTTTAHWSKLNYLWVTFFICAAISNWYIAFNFSTDVWVNFKFFGLMGMTIFFLILQFLYIAFFIPNCLKEVNNSSQIGKD